MVSKLRIDGVRPFLESNYTLIIKRHLGSQIVGRLILKNEKEEYLDEKEVEVGTFVSLLGNISKYLDYQYCSTSYDREKDKIINSFKDCRTNQVVLEVKSDNVFSGFVLLDKEIRYNIYDEKTEEKEKIYEK